MFATRGELRSAMPLFARKWELPAAPVRSDKTNGCAWEHSEANRVLVRLSSIESSAERMSTDSSVRQRTSQIAAKVRGGALRNVTIRTTMVLARAE